MTVTPSERVVMERDRYHLAADTFLNAAPLVVVAPASVMIMLPTFSPDDEAPWDLEAIAAAAGEPSQSSWRRSS